MARIPNHTGQGGKSFQDRELASKVRTQALNDLYLILTNDKKIEKWSDLKRQVLLKMSTTILPRLNEHSGPDGSPIPLLNVLHNTSDTKDRESSEED